MRIRRPKSLALISILSLALSLLIPTSAPALSFKSTPAKTWGFIRAGDNSMQKVKAAPRPTRLEGEKKSEWQVNYEGFPVDAKSAVQYAIDIWSRNFASKVTINVDAKWERNSDKDVLGSARPGFYFSAFPGAPDETLWYPSALANALAGKDLNTTQEEIVLRLNSTPLWHTGTDGKPGPQSYDLVSVVLHEIAHGLGFLSNAEYDRFFGTGYMFQPTPFDAYVQLPDGRTFTDFCSRSIDLGKAMLGPLYWSGTSAITANRGAKPKLYTPTPYQDGSSITHLDEETFAKSSTDSMMTPNLNPGESFTSPGPIALAMIDDMLRKPPAAPAAEIPAKPVNVKALIGDAYALITFDTPNCSRVDRVSSYKVTVVQTGKTKRGQSSPIRINGLKNGKSYSFTVVAENEKGASEPVESNSIKPQQAGKVTTIDPYSKVSYLAAATYRGANVIAYNDERTNTLKLATRSGTKWRITTARKNVNVGPISLCTKGTGSKQILYALYAEKQTKDLMLSTLKSNKWRHETIDGNGESVQDYREFPRTKTASDVSISNACAVTSGGLQVFYRDETQGILLGAVKTTNGWVYEIIDGDRDTSGRTTGDTAFALAATTNKDTVYVLYDSVLTINSNRQPTEGEVRLATRKTVFAEDWKFRTLDGPENGTAVAGFGISIFNNSGDITAAWLSSRGDSILTPLQVTYQDLSESSPRLSVTTGNFGAPHRPISLDSDGLTFDCQNRSCNLDIANEKIVLISGFSSAKTSDQLTRIGKTRVSITVVNQRLSFINIR
jgi:hypothetical protein